MSKPHPKVKSMGLFVSNGRFLASSHHDYSKGEDYLRLLGGHVEFGERSDETLRREMMEELGAGIANLALLDVVENIFVYEGRPGHETVFLYRATFTDPSFYTRDRIPFIETGSEDVALWSPVEDVLSGSVRLYPPADYAKLLRLAAEP
jgi:8-oxo-dGTP pyrophosphatase MutT (NUDIX family)